MWGSGSIKSDPIDFWSVIAAVSHRETGDEDFKADGSEFQVA